ncbi:imidazolonepropionase [Desulfosarcina ovata subsp. sediminis]|uniref:Imidazolonepropionase n=1 Tax=Desulfosarcina ovata subsp. sediminis TaxID=885957 RepID=A0A5K7ZUQ7_9BACT|nr:imidazolonepropionase [Desulfosarcina ovata]BBO83967.1 imidazolonepropionase [Desulfosarcina ovata subsp. sediminis]
MPDRFPSLCDLLFTHANLATMAAGKYHIKKDAALAVSGKTIAWIGAMANLPEEAASLAKTVIDCEGKWLLPGFVDCHTHMVWGGSRSNEFEMRLKGASYGEIAAQGGGIASTVSATRAASAEALLAIGLKRAHHFLTQGITCFEVKSGYGLDMDSELKMLSVIREMDRTCPQDIHATFLGAHALPPEYKGRQGAYTDLVVEEMLPAVKAQGVASAVDVFCEKIAFSREETRRIFKTATDMGFGLKLHAEQLSDCDGAALAADFKALSCDHLEYLSPTGAKAMAENGVIPVLLPGAFHYLKEIKIPPMELFRSLDMPMALATDLNPGTSPVFNMTLVLNLACILFGMTCEEAIAGATLHGARALGINGTKGSLEPGKDADITLWDMEAPSDLCYLSGLLSPELVVTGGKIEYKN